METVGNANEYLWGAECRRFKSSRPDQNGISYLGVKDQAAAMRLFRLQHMCGAERFGLRQRSAKAAFENPQRRLRGVEHCLNRQMKCLLQRILAAHRGVRYPVGEYHPSASGRKLL